ncbi:carboxylesterase/lipase family protein [Thermomonospora umbrina]|uniref:Para-nitrobenzyl esterase n=1 Tax=Thermomonospora umbrina TaxID=111806 RepID=A0A3D9SW55_9ACTN|nr:carboxylesterase family protein [Thermomonospora umbrina]REE96804.1 para-nitrobenzyl esterase [Thermomonospora umbrina]
MLRRTFAVVLCALLVVVTAGRALALPDAVVHLDTGAVRGVAAHDHRAFLGIPYARPPVGALRWRAPEPAEPWTGVRDATAFGGKCAQPATSFDGLIDNEDCLNLNVFTPARRADANLPVIVWLHGGSYAFGDGNVDAGAMAAAAGAVVVTLNFRQGAFGVLALEALRAENPALNHGVQDQQAALRWVQRNIGVLGGDRTRVTLMGQSSGGGATCSNIASPAAAGLFHRAVLMSSSVCGTEQRYGVTLDTARQTGEAYASKLGCPAGPGQLDCLRGKSARELVEAAPFTEDAQIPFLFPPILDGVVIPAPPVAMIKSGAVPRRPVLAGLMDDEGYLFAALGLKVQTGVVPTEEDYRRLITAFAGPGGAVILALYPSLRYGSPLKAMSALMGDMMFGCGTRHGLQQLSPLAPTYAYLFEDPQAPPVVPGLARGSTHAAELIYLFGPRSPLLDPGQQELAGRFLRHLGTFAATGDPADWPRYDRLGQRILRFRPGTAGGTHGFGHLYVKHRCHIWDLLGSFIGT